MSRIGEAGIVRSGQHGASAGQCACGKGQPHLFTVQLRRHPVIPFELSAEFRMAQAHRICNVDNTQFAAFMVAKHGRCARAGMGVPADRFMGLKGGTHPIENRIEERCFDGLGRAAFEQKNSQACKHAGKLVWSALRSSTDRRDVERCCGDVLVRDEDSQKIGSRLVFTAVYEPSVDPHPVAWAHLQPAAAKLKGAATFAPGKSQACSSRNDGPGADIAKIPSDHHPAVAVRRRPIVPARWQGQKACNSRANGFIPHGSSLWGDKS